MIEIGTSIGRYHILERLGEGGMAIVYKAYDTRLEREVALKVIRVDAFPPAILERVLKRFEREAFSLARLSHPNIVKVFDFGEHAGAPYLVMEFIPGGTLKQLTVRPMPWKKAGLLLIPIAQALDYAHQKGVVHRDVKPANILMAEQGQPMLTDFGIAKILEDDGGGATLTGTGVGIGTPEYMAPEQGLGEEVDARADIYALGVVFFELVTGRKPFIADTPLAVLHKQVYDPLPRPRQYVPNLPKSVEQVIFKALAKKPEDRYPNMAAFAAALEGLAGSVDQPVARSGGGEKKPGNTQQGSNRGDSFRLLETEVEATETVDVLPIPPRKKAHSRFWNSAVIVAAIGVVIIGAVAWGIKALGPLAVPAQTTAHVTPSQAATIIPTDLQTQTASPVHEVTPTLPLANDLEIDSNGNMVIRLGQGELELIAFSPDGKYLVVGSPIGIYVYDAKTLSELHTYISNKKIVALAISPDGRWLAGTWDGAIRLWDLETGTLLHNLRGHDAQISSLIFSPNGRELGSASRDGVIIWDVENGAMLKRLSGHNNFIKSMAFSPDGSKLASGSYDNTIMIWDANHGKLLQTLNAGLELYKFNVLAFSPDGRYLSSGWGDLYIRIWDVETGNLIEKLNANCREVRGIIYSPDGRLMASRSDNYDIRVWDGDTGALLLTLNGHTSNITSIAFSQDGQLLASGSYDNTIKIWDPIGGVLIKTLEGHSGNVNNIAFSSDGQSLVSVSEDGTIRVWNISHIR